MHIRCNTLFACRRQVFTGESYKNNYVSKNPLFLLIISTFVKKTFDKILEGHLLAHQDKLTLFKTLIINMLTKVLIRLALPHHQFSVSYVACALTLQGNEYSSHYCFWNTYVAIPTPLT